MKKDKNKKLEQNKNITESGDVFVNDKKPKFPTFGKKNNEVKENDLIKTENNGEELSGADNAETGVTELNETENQAEVVGQIAEPTEVVTYSGETLNNTEQTSEVQHPVEENSGVAKAVAENTTEQPAVEKVDANKDTEQPAEVTASENAEENQLSIATPNEAVQTAEETVNESTEVNADGGKNLEQIGVVEQQTEINNSGVNAEENQLSAGEPSAVNQTVDLKETENQVAVENGVTEQTVEQTENVTTNANMETESTEVNVTGEQTETVAESGKTESGIVETVGDTIDGNAEVVTESGETNVVAGEKTTGVGNDDKTVEQTTVASATENQTEGEDGEVGETSEVASPEEPKKPKWAFPKKASAEASAKMILTEDGELKTEEEVERDKALKAEADIEEEIEEEIVDEDGNPIEEPLEKEVDEDGNPITEEVIEEEVLEEEVDETDSETIVADGESLSQAKTSDTVEVDDVEGYETVASESLSSDGVTSAITSGSGLSEVAGVGLTEVDNSALISENEKRRSKFVMFPKKGDNNGAVNGGGFNKSAIIDDTRSVRRRKQESAEPSEVDIENEIKRPKPLWLKIVISSVAVLVGIFAILSGYVGYLQLGHDRVYDWKFIKADNNRSTLVLRSSSYEAITYNINYGMMNPEVSYIGSVGYLADGKKVEGTDSRAMNKDRVNINVNGSAGLVSSGEHADTDFILLQQIDLDSTRSFYVNEQDLINNILKNYASVYAECGTSNYVLGSAFGSVMGKTNCRMATYSAHKVTFAIRYSLPSNEKFLVKYGTNDNCVILTRFKISGVNDKYLSVINVNLSRYEDNSVREADMKAIFDIINTEHNVLGNYCVVGGSFSYLLHGTSGEFKNNMQTPDWSKNLPECFSRDALSGIGFRICVDDVALDQKIGTVRDASVIYEDGVTYEAITDGFIVSDDIDVELTTVIDNGFLYSSHNPVKIKFNLRNM